ncbi:MAG: hypothetical protein H7319_09655 [Spirosoma sp.]|nr:hypothetical protein [Spirosoma sp.]
MAKTVNDQKTKVVRFSDKFKYNNPVNFYVTNLYDFPKLGAGFDTRSGTSLNTGTPFEKLDVLKVEGSVENTASNYSFDAFMVESKTNLLEDLQFDISVQAKYLAYKGKATFKLEDFSYSQDLSIVWLVICEKYYSSNELNDITFKASAEEILTQPTKFIATYGDSFVSSLTFGNKVLIKYEFTANTIEEKNKMSIEVEASMKALKASGKVTSTFTSLVTSASASQRLSVKMIVYGDKQGPESIAFTDLESLQAKLSTFIKDLSKADATVLRFQTTHYPQLDNYSVLLNIEASKLFLEKYFQIDAELVLINKLRGIADINQDQIEELETCTVERKLYKNKLLRKIKRYYDVTTDANEEETVFEELEKLIFREKLPVIPKVEPQPVLSCTWKGDESVPIEQFSTGCKFVGLPIGDSVTIRVNLNLAIQELQNNYPHVVGVWFQCQLFIDQIMFLDEKVNRKDVQIHSISRDFNIPRPIEGVGVIRLKTVFATYPDSNQGTILIKAGSSIEVIN